MAEEQVNPFGVQQPQAQPGMVSLTPQGGVPPEQGGSYFSLSPEAMQMMWAPQPQQINPLM